MVGTERFHEYLRAVRIQTRRSVGLRDARTVAAGYAYTYDLGDNLVTKVEP
jgi:hypothetical protein